MLAVGTACTPAHQRLSRQLDLAVEQQTLRLVYAPVDADVAPAVEAGARHAWNAIRRWGIPASPVTIRIYPDHESLISAIGIEDFPWLRAWARFDEILLQSPRTWGIDYSQQLPELLTHELTHVAMYQRIGTVETWERRDLPLWFREGMASFTAQQGYRRGTPEEVGRQLKDNPTLTPLYPDPDLLKNHKDLVYNSGHWCFDFLVRQGDEASIRELLTGIRQGLLFEAAFAQVYGHELDEFLSRFRAKLEPKPEPFPAAPVVAPAVP